MLPAILRTLPAYLTVAGVLIAIHLLHGILSDSAASVPFLGPLLTAVLGVYGLMFSGRLIGLFYRQKREAIGWE